MPRELWKKNIASDSIEIKWLPPANPEGIIMRYRLELKNEETKALTTAEIEATTSSRPYVYKFTDLDGETNYNIKVI